MKPNSSNSSNLPRQERLLNDVFIIVGTVICLSFGRVQIVPVVKMKSKSASVYRFVMQRVEVLNSRQSFESLMCCSFELNLPRLLICLVN